MTVRRASEQVRTSETTPTKRQYGFDRTCFSCDEVFRSTYRGGRVYCVTCRRRHGYPGPKTARERCASQAAPNA